MDSQDRRAAVVSRVLAKYRKVVRVVRLMPFIYLLLYVFVAIPFNFISEDLVCVADCSLFLSPFVSAFALLLSGALGMCRWHKAACLLPYSSRVVSFIDRHFFTFTQVELILINIAVAICVVLFILFSLRHFFFRDARLQARS